MGRLKPRLMAAVALVVCFALHAAAKARLTPYYSVANNTYNFWLYLPENYEEIQGNTPLILFLHGASLCGRNLNSVKRYGPIDAVEEGRKIDAVIVAPQCPGGGWKPDKVHATLEWVKQNFAYDHQRVYVVGMSMGGYGAIDYCATYYYEVAAGIGMCGGAYVDVDTQQNLAMMPFWLIHGTADRAVSINESKKVAANIMAAPGGGDRLKTTWLQGGNHGAPARVFYHRDTYSWLFSHNLTDDGRPVNRDYDFTLASLRGAYNSMPRGVVSVINSSKGSVVKFTDADFDGDEFENITYEDIDFDAGEFVPAGFDDGESTGDSIAAGGRGVLNTEGRKKVKQAEDAHNASGDAANGKSKKAEKTAGKTVTVRSGDTLGAIARRNHTTVEQLCHINGIKRNATLQIGQKLKIK
ncbi:MAG: LysM peptidoglycan-binding domain-containing protein [Muribaculaceae bacterium]